MLQDLKNKPCRLWLYQLGIFENFFELKQYTLGLVSYHRFDLNSCKVWRFTKNTLDVQGCGKFHTTTVNVAEVTLVQTNSRFELNKPIMAPLHTFGPLFGRFCFFKESILLSKSVSIRALHAKNT